MRTYKEDIRELEAVICNKCKKNLLVEKGVLKEGHFEGKQVFGYFSQKDGTEHKFDLCEDCYNQIISTFAIPVNEKEISEFL